ncbi:SGNH/GDSL hydrolase family protein [Rhizobium sp. C1]|uniref:SGNH/GDSL hydrolase family protein n=1 Tax=Rhizobium sp. C1 TaxID=1349799 RepID=UPI001E5AB916|nr:hypothetical protein [Rhizobium sp. C1]MCD2176430.1 hypothetical protein [Rhizobium sp. C1]
MLSSGLTIPIERQISKAGAVKSFSDTLSKGVRARPVFDATPVPYALFALQLVRSGYTGPIVTLRRTSDNAETAFYPRPSGYLSRAEIMGWAGTSELRVKIWHDQMGAHDALQTITAQQPVFDWSGGEPMIYNVNLPTSLGLQNALSFARNLGGVSVAVVGDGTTGIAETLDIASFRAGSGNSQFSLRAQSGKWGAFLRRINNGNFALPVSTKATTGTGWTSAIMEADLANNAPRVTVDGVTTTRDSFDAALTSDEDATDAPRIGASPDGGAAWFGFIRAVGFFRKAFSSSERAAVGAALDYLKPRSANRYLACWGDSLTQGGYPAYLATMMGSYRYVYDGGVGGESIASIRARQAADVYYNARINLLEGGRNGFKTLTATEIEADMALMVAHVVGGRFLVGAVTPFANDPATGSGADTPDDTAKRLALNALRQSSYGDRYVDPMPYFASASNGSAEDLADIAAGWIPRSLRSDGGHLNAAGQMAKARAYRDKLISLGW